MEKLFRGLVLFMVILLLQLTLLPSNEAYAEQSGVTLTEMEIKVMPEFVNPENWDQTLPSLLIGYHGTFKNNTDTTYTGELKVSVPLELPNFQQGYVANFSDQEDVDPIEENYTVNEEEQTFSWTPKTPIEPNENYYFVLEYFAGSIEGDTDRQFNFEYTAETDFENVNVAFYIPHGSEDFQLDKEPHTISETFGLELYLFDYSDVKQGDILDFSASYKKDNIVTTMEAFNDSEAPKDDAHAGFTEEEEGTTEDKTSKPFLNAENVVLIILSLIIIGSFVFIIARRTHVKTPGSKKKAKTPKKIFNKEEEIKKLRKMLADGQIDERTYKEKREKLG